MKKRKKKKKEIPLLDGVKITFVHFDGNGKINLLDNLKELNWIEYGKDKKV